MEDDCSKYDCIESAKMTLMVDVVNKFDLNKYYKRSVKQFELAQDVVNKFKHKLFHEVTKFDIFKELRVDFNENSISDVINSLLTPKKSPFGKELIINILIQYEKADIAVILENTSLDKIFCQREVSGDDSRIDIRMSTHNEDCANAIIDFELKGKNPYACETTINGENQTVREYRALENQQQNYISNYHNRCEIAAFYITPNGTSPKSNKFIGVSYDDIRVVINNLIDKIVKEDPKSAYQFSVIKAFFNSKWLF